MIDIEFNEVEQLIQNETKLIKEYENQLHMEKVKFEEWQLVDLNSEVNNVESEITQMMQAIKIQDLELDRLKRTISSK